MLYLRASNSVYWTALLATVLLASCSGAEPGSVTAGNELTPSGLRQVVRADGTMRTVPLGDTQAFVATGEATGIARPNAVSAGLYAAFDNVGVTLEYPAHNAKNRKPRCTIPQQTIYPLSIGVDKAGTLWVPQQNFISGSYPITSYAPNCGTPGITLLDPNAPGGIAFDSKGTNYVLDLTGSGSSGYGDVSVFPRNHTTPSRTLSKPIAGTAWGIDVDSHDNVYVMYINASGTGTVAEFKKGKMPGTTLGVTTSYLPGGTLIFDRNNNMIVNENNVVSTLEIFAPPYNGTPAVFPLMGASHQCALNKTGKNLACADFGNNSVDVFAYPSIKYQYSITKGIPTGGSGAGVTGVAYSPVAPN
jgi:hypothetical protein